MAGSRPLGGAAAAAIASVKGRVYSPLMHAYAPRSFRTGMLPAQSGTPPPPSSAQKAHLQPQAQLAALPRLGAPDALEGAWAAGTASRQPHKRAAQEAGCLGAGGLGAARRCCKCGVCVRYSGLGSRQAGAQCKLATARARLV